MKFYCEQCFYQEEGVCHKYPHPEPVAMNYWCSKGVARPEDMGIYLAKRIVSGHRISCRLAMALRRLNINTIQDILRIRDVDILCLKNAGMHTVKDLWHLQNQLRGEDKK
jgi:hypothetical protein